MNINQWWGVLCISIANINQWWGVLRISIVNISQQQSVERLEAEEWAAALLGDMDRP